MPAFRTRSSTLRKTYRTNTTIRRSAKRSGTWSGKGGTKYESRSAEKPVKVWTDDDATLNVREVVDEDTGEVVKRIPMPVDLEMGPDDEARFYARKEIREALDMLIDLVGAAEPEQVELSGEVDTGPDMDELADMAEDLF